MIAKVRGRVVTPGVFVGGLYTPGIRKENLPEQLRQGCSRRSKNRMLPPVFQADT